MANARKIERHGESDRAILNEVIDVVNELWEARPQSPCEKPWHSPSEHCQPTECEPKECRKCKGVGCPIGVELNEDGLCEHCVAPESKECEFDFSKMSPGVQCQRCSIKPCGKTCPYAVSTPSDWEPYFDKWVKQGRSGEQIYGVTNFMTGQGAIMLKDLLSQQRQEVIECRSCKICNKHKDY